jgi:6-phosphogluconolactonase
MRLRSLLSLLLLILLATAAFAQTYIAYIGTYTDGASKGIYAFRFDSKSGTAKPLGLVAESPNPEFLAAPRSGNFLYATNEIDTYKGAPTGSVTAFKVDRGSGKLKWLNTVSSAGAGPAHISLDKSGRFALVANYGGGSVAVLPVAQDGTLGRAVSFQQHRGSSVNKERQMAPHAHSIKVSNDNRFALSADLGIDKLMIYRFDSVHGKLTPNTHGYAQLAPGSGPRHFSFAPSGKFVYVTNELTSTVTVFAWDEKTGNTTELQTISTLPADWKGENSTAEILVHPNGKHLYVSNRGRDSIALFSIDQSSGKLTFVEDVATGGKTPRNFNFDPTGKWLWAANQNSGDIFIFRVDEESGRMTRAGEPLKVDKPVAVLFVKE